MYTSYIKLWKLLVERGLTKTDLCRATGMSTRTLAKLVANRSVTTDTLLSVCEALDCGIEDIMEFTKEPPERPLALVYKEHSKKAVPCGALQVVEFTHLDTTFKIGVTNETANRHTVIHCEANGVVWEQLYPVGISPAETRSVICPPAFLERGKVCILLIDGYPANITGLDEAIYLSAKREYRDGGLYVMSTAAFKLFRTTKSEG